MSLNTRNYQNAVRTELFKEDNRISSPKTTNVRINKLIQSQVLRYEKTKIVTGFYKLYVTDRTPYLTIVKQIERIHFFVDKISGPLKEVDKLSRSAGLVKGPTMAYMNKFIIPYFTLISTMLERLLDESNNSKD